MALQPILDPCCGAKMMWFDKQNQRALFGDVRSESHTLCDGRALEIKPDLVMDFTALPFDDETFRLVVFDPPHLIYAGEKSWLRKKYGRLNAQWRESLKKGFAECFRVLKPEGILIFKWNESQIKIKGGDMSVLREIGIIARALDSIANIEFRDIELARGQYLYLVRIAENPGIIQEELSELLKVDRSTVARSVKKLEAKGLVQQKAAKDNKKNKEWFVTEKGETLYPFILSENDYSEETSLQGFSQAEVQALEKMLVRVRENITGDWEAVKKGQKRNY